MIDLPDEAPTGALLARTSARGGVVTIGAQGARFIIRLVSQIAIARLLVPADYGLVAMVAPVIALITLLGDLGLGQAVVQRAEISHREITILFWLGLAMNCLLTLVIVALAPFLAWAYGEPRLLLIVVALGLVMPLSGLASQQLALFTRNLRFGLLAIVDVVPPALSLLAGLAAALAHLGYWALVIMSAVDAASRAVLLWSVSRWRPGPPSYDRSVWSLLRVGGHITGYNLAGYVTTSADNVLLALTHGEVALGLYDRGYRIVTEPIQQLIAPFNRVATPLLLRLRDDDRRYRIAFVRMTQLMQLAGIPALISVMMFAKPLVLLLLGPQWAPSAPVLAWLCLGGFGSSLYTSTFWLFVSQHRTREQLHYVLATSAISVAGFVIGLPWGAVGVAAGASLSFILVAVPLTCWGATREGPVSTILLLKSLAPLAFAGLVTATALSLLLRQAGPIDNLFVVGAAFALAYALFGATLATMPMGRRIVTETWAIRALMRGGDPA